MTSCHGDGPGRFLGLGKLEYETSEKEQVVNVPNRREKREEGGWELG